MKSHYKDIHSSTLLKWHCVKKTCAPCFVCPHVDEALAGHDDVKLTARNNTLVRFLGYHNKYHDMLQPVPSSQLKDWNCSDGLEIYSNWSPVKMKAFLAAIRNQKEFKGDDGKLKLRTEELVIQLVLASVLKRAQDAEAALSVAVPEEGEDDEISLNGTMTSPRTWDSPAAVASVAAARNVAANPNQVKKLRAGDTIAYLYVHCLGAFFQR